MSPENGKRRYRLYQVDAFTREKLKGNPAGVVPDADGMSVDAMQAVAREMNNSETAFILPPDGPDHDVRVRFFTPSVEVPICGHATIAAHYVRARELGLPDCRVVHKTGAGVLPVDVAREGDDYRIVMTQGAAEIGGLLPESLVAEALAALGLGHEHRDRRCPVRIASTGHSKVMVGITDRKVLDGLRPDMTALAALSGRVGSNGWYVFALGREGAEPLVHGRMFAPAIGIDEDPVTGNANGPLGAYLVGEGLLPGSGTVSFTARQGEAMGRPGTVEVEVDARGGEPVAVRVAGRAVVAFVTELEL